MLVYLVPFALLGAVTLGLFIGLHAGRNENKLAISLKDSQFANLTSTAESYLQAAAYYKTQMEYYKALVSLPVTKSTLDG